MDAVESVVIGNNSRMLHAGYGGEDVPRTVFPCVVGSYRFSATYVNGLQVTYCVGDDCYRRHGRPTINHPVKDGIITNWDEMEKIWHHTFYNELRIDPTEQPVLLVETPHNPKPDREKTAQIMFETLGVPAMYLKNQDVLSLYSYGYTTGLVFDAGATTCRATPIFDGHALLPAMSTTNIGGDDLVQHLATSVFEETQHLFNLNNVHYDRSIAEEILEKLCYVKTRAEEPNQPKKYELPDGMLLDLSESRVACAEVLFNPELVRKEINPIQDVIYKAILKCDQDAQREMRNNIVLAGGLTKLEGIEKRLTLEMNKLSRAPVRISASLERKYATWIGGSIFASLSTTRDLWITKAMYDEIGADVLHRICPQTSYVAESHLHNKIMTKQAFSDMEINCEL
jgi:actin-related protein